MKSFSYGYALAEGDMFNTKHRPQFSGDIFLMCWIKCGLLWILDDIRGFEDAVETSKFDGV